MYFSAIHFPQRFLLLISNQEASENNFLLGALGMYLVQRFKLAVLCNIALTASSQHPLLTTRKLTIL